ncbi:ABC transporter permease [Mycolicibacterium baixiangningiae]|uniref:ABC transporter permease n=1 Tax=Mycolicibacterium baixiangningiae TaxID=2761578 RepID=UPI0018D1D84B|nr:ABC transporter permease [Mycolicibacterium baixiangningiae]
MTSADLAMVRSSADLVGRAHPTAHATDFQDLNDAELARARSKRLRGRLLGIAGFLGIGIVLIGGWEWAVRAGHINPRLAPAPSDIVAHLPTVLTASYFPKHLMVTVQELVIGFCLGVFLGVALGTLVSLSDFCRAVIQPYVLALEAPPKALLAPLFVTLFGFGITSKVVMAVIIAFFPLFVGTVAGLSALNPDAERLMKSLNASRAQVFMKVRFPNALPLMASGIRLCWTLTVTGVIVAEFVGAQAGLGFLLNSFNFQSDILGVFSVIVLLALGTVTVYWLLEFLERRIVFWERI